MTKVSSSALCIMFLAAALMYGCGDKPPMMSENPQFSAKLVSESDGSAQEYEFSMSGNMARLDMISPGKGTVIIRKDLGVDLALMTQKKLFLQLPIRPENKNPLVFAPDRVLKYEKLGEETVDGHPVIRERMTIQNEGDEKKEFYRWFATDINWPLKVEDVDGKWSIRLEGLKAGPQDPVLFSIPDDYLMIAPRQGQTPPG